MESNPLRHILKIARDKEVPRRFIVNDLEALVRELREEVEEDHICGYCSFSVAGICKDSSDDCKALEKIKEILGDEK